MIKPCALIPDLVHMCCTLVPGMLCHPSHGTDCSKCGKVLRLPLRSNHLYNWISQFQFDSRPISNAAKGRTRPEGLRGDVGDDEDETERV